RPVSRGGDREGDRRARGPLPRAPAARRELRTLRRPPRQGRPRRGRPAGDRRSAAVSEEESYVAPRDPFYRGILLRFARGTGLGVVRSATSGREVGFELQHVLVLGEGGVESLREGIPVGYDVG